MEKTWKKTCKTSGNHTLPSKKHNNSRDITEYHRNCHWAAAAFGAHFKCSGISKPQSFSGKDNHPTWRTGPGRRPDSLAKRFFCGSNYSPTLPYTSIPYVFIVQCRHRHHHHHPEPFTWNARDVETWPMLTADVLILWSTAGCGYQPWFMHWSATAVNASWMKPWPEK
jgi:hypothetical protein